MRKTSTEVASTSREAVYARLALVGVALYVVLDVVAQALPPHYSPISQAESDLGVGPYGWVMAINFVVRGLLSLAAVLALRSSLPTRARSALGFTLGEALLALWGIGAVVLAFFPTDLPGQHPTLHGMVHLVVAFVAFLGGAVGAVVLSRRLGADPRLRAVAPAANGIAILAIAALVLTFLSAPTHIFGLCERVFIGLVLLWIVVVMARIQSSNQSSNQSSQSGA